MHHPGGKPDRQGQGPEVSAAVKTLRVEESRSGVGHARVGSFEDVAPTRPRRRRIFVHGQRPRGLLARLGQRSPSAQES